MCLGQRGLTPHVRGMEGNNMTMEEFNKTKFYFGIGFKLSANGPVHRLATVDFETGQCEDDDGKLHDIESVYQFCDGNGGRG